MVTEKFKDLFIFGQKSKIKAGDGLKEGKFPFYTSSPVLSKRIDTEQHFDEALIFGTGGLPSIHYVNEPFATSTDCLVAIARIEKSFNVKYVYFYIFGNIRILEQGFKGAGLKHISKTYIQNIDIPLPDLETQNKIVAILDKAKILIDKRDETIKGYDDLLRATFLDMFGDPVLNPMKWEKKTISEYTDCIVPGRDKPKSFTGAIPWFTTEDLLQNGFVISSKKNLGLNEYEIKQVNAKIIPEGSVIITCVGDLGIVSINKESCVVNQQLHTYQCNKNINNVFLMMQLTFFKKYLFKIASITTVPYMNKSTCNSIPIIKPDIKLQNKFCNIFLKIEDFKTKLNTSKNELENLLNSLSQQAFSGQILFDIDVQLEALINNVDIRKKNEENNIETLKNDVIFLQRLLDKLNDKEFEDMEQYDKAKYIVFRIMKEEENLIKQDFDTTTNKIKLTV